ncbi:MAG: methyltransferase domain-containing protein [Thermoleophilaceae bacterium]|nr:methyltransferase domain-containing protein [Thermoleophilaceae bacterium]
MSALDRVLKLTTPEHRPAEPDVLRGYLDLLGDSDPTGARPGQRLMSSRVLPLIYETVWRPVGGRLLMGVLGPGMEDERLLAVDMLELSPGERVLDVACGPGNFTRAFASAVGPTGLVAGIDASPTMLQRAVEQAVPDNVAYVRGDAAALPFVDASFDAVCCFAALYLIEDPVRAIDEIVRVLAPGGRVALLSSVSRGPLPSRLADLAVRPLTGVRIFGRHELTGALSERGLAQVAQRVSGLAQFVSGRRP